ncbi:MAG: hypothetical protein CVU64_07660 [Deltaproteobacteria bacterium HGW-Deltaproteobacteria-21]|nr:MAG: hypothetical protein CVU64_07660 [Deltaproteobacteria bacterium HGW-Deltaproteobacteria-21]
MNDSPNERSTPFSFRRQEGTGKLYRRDIKGDRTATIVALSLFLLALFVYWPVLHHDFIIWDDYDYIVNNPFVSSGLSVKNAVLAFTSSHSSNWHPLTWISHMLDVELYGVNPGLHHWNNVLLHSANTALLFFLLYNMTGAIWRSAFICAFFSLHPLHVESVAWVSERKDVLSTFFWMLSLLAYLSYARRQNLKTYALTFLFFACGLMSKSMVVTLPFVLLLLDYWPLGRFRDLREKGKGLPRIFFHLCMEKIPFFVLSGCSSILTFLVQKEWGAVASSSALPLDARLSNAVISYVRYIVKMFWPVDLSAFYPFPQNPWSFHLAASALLLLTALSILVLASRRPHLFVGWFWYLGTLVPVIGLVQVGPQAMADRYTYIPHVGLLIALVWSIYDLCRRPRIIVWISTLSGLLILLLGLSTRSQLGYWQDSVSLFSHAIHVTQNNPRAHFHLGEALFSQGKIDEAVWYYTEAVRISPEEPLFLNGLASAQLAKGQYEEALLHLHEAIRIRPGYAEAMANIGSALWQRGDAEGAILYLRKTLDIKPSPEANHLLGLVFSGQGELDKAISNYRQALEMKPGDHRIHNDLAVAFYLAGEFEGAILHLSEALRLHPGDTGVLRNLQLIRSEIEKSKRSDRSVNSPSSHLSGRPQDK